MIEVPFVLLAAGRSTRMGASKALLDFQGRPWLVAQVQAIRAQTAGPIRVVLGPQNQEEATLLSGQEGVRAVLNSEPDRGPFSSLQAGLAGLEGPTFLGPLDCPIAPVLATLHQALLPGLEAVVPTFGGKGGHPVCLSAGLIVRLLSLEPGGQGSRLDVQLRSARVQRLEVTDPRVALNLNTPEGWRLFLAP